MKKLIPFLCAALLAGAFAGCDDKNDDNGDNPGPPPAGKKSVASMTISEEGGQPVTVAFVYDAEGRVTAIGGVNIAYGDNMLEAAGTWTEPGDSYTVDFTYTLSGGKAVSMKGTEKGSSYTEYYEQEYGYNGDYLSRIEDTSDEEDPVTIDFKWTGDDITSLTARDEDGPLTMTITPGSVANDMNINLFGIVYGFINDSQDYAMILDFTGQRSASMPRKIAYPGYSADLEYATDADGYITSITFTEPDETALVFTFTYK